MVEPPQLPECPGCPHCEARLVAARKLNEEAHAMMAEMHRRQVSAASVEKIAAFLQECVNAVHGNKFAPPPGIHSVNPNG